MNAIKKRWNILNIPVSGRIRLLCFLSGVALLLSVLSVILLQSELVKDWEDRFQSRYYLLRAYFSEPRASQLPLVLVLIDDHSLPANTARSPIDRRWLAELVAAIDEQDPLLIGLNVLLDRPGDAGADQKLIEEIEKAGNVILRDDPFYPVYPPFARAALDKGTVKFRLDSSDTVQAVCVSVEGCRSPDLFYRKIIETYRFASGQTLDKPDLESDWLKINFMATRRKGSAGKLLSFPSLRAHELSRLPPDALKDKIILVGTGFPDLYPLYRTPVTPPDQLYQETEIIAQVLNMVASGDYLKPLSPLLVGCLILLALLVISLVMIYVGIIAGIVSTFLMILLIFLVNAWLFAYCSIESPFVLPAVSVFAYYLFATMIFNVQERFARLTSELKLKQAKIDYLTNELHSHHLFNEFSRLSVMIQKDPQAAKEYLVEFAEMLRYSLKYGDQRMVPVSVQLAYLKSYLNQQGVVVGDRLAFELQVDQSVEQLLAPWHTFFPLVENAVKYTEGYLQEGLAQTARITIELKREAKLMKMIVSNPYSPRAQVISSKTGLKNLKQRLEWAYPNGGYQLEAKHDEHTWINELKLPIREIKG